MNVTKLLLAGIVLAGSTLFTQSALAARPTCTDDATWAHIDGAVGNVRVWYELASAPDLAQAQEIVAAIDNSIWPTLITGLGFTAPLSDASLLCNGGDGRLDIFVVQGLGPRGQTVPESGTDFQSITYINIRNGQSGGELQYLVTHQFMHSVEWSYVMVAEQLSYGWMRNALANWAVEAVYPGNARLQADASCHMNSNFLSITSLSTGACSGSTTRTRDYGAYLLYQYIGRTYGNTKVRELLAATTVSPTALDAIDGNVTGGLSALWPKYAVALWNQAPVTRGTRPSPRNFDGQTSVPVLAPDQPTTVNADLNGSSREQVTNLSTTVANTSTRYYRFTFSDEGTRSLMFRNTFYPLYKAGNKITVWAMWRVENGNWIEENWSNKEWIGLCRDAKVQRVAELVLVVASAEVGAVTQVVAAEPPVLKRNNIGCWGFSGSVQRSDRSSTWSSGLIRVTGNVLFDYKPGGTPANQYNDPATGRLRVPIEAPNFRSDSWTLVEAYSEGGCSFALNQSGSNTSILLGGTASGVLMINNFAESLPAALRQQQYTVLGSVRGAYILETHVLPFPPLVGTVTGPQPKCGNSYQSAVGSLVLSNSSAANVPIITLNGHLKGSFTSSPNPDPVIFTWDLAPQREP